MFYHGSVRTCFYATVTPDAFVVIEHKFPALVGNDFCRTFFNTFFTEFAVADNVHGPVREMISHKTP